MEKIKITEFEFEITNKLINGIDVKLKEPENYKVFQVYSLDEEREVWDLIISFDTMEEAVEFAKNNNMEVAGWKILNLYFLLSLYW